MLKRVFGNNSPIPIKFFRFIIISKQCTSSYAQRTNQKQTIAPKPFIQVLRRPYPKSPKLSFYMEEKDELSRTEKVEDCEEYLCEEEAAAAAEEVNEERLKMEGMASIALLPNGSISGHFVHLPQSVCYGIHGTELACERECSRGEDYRLVKLTIIDFNSKKERDVVVERRGHDAARLCDVDHAHGWEKDVVNLVDQKHQKSKIVISFECETLKADEAAEEHIKRFMPKLTGMDAVVNIGKMSITGLDFKAEAVHLEQSS